MKCRLSGYIVSFTATLASGSLLFAQGKDEKEVRTTRIVVNDGNFEQVRKRVAEHLEKASVSEEVRERVLREMDSISLNSSKLLEKVNGARNDAKQPVEHNIKVKDGNEQLEIVIDGDEDNEQVFRRIFRADVMKDLVQKYRIGVACGTSEEENSDTDNGLIVRSVISDSPAFKAGIKEKDQLVVIDGKKLESVGQLLETVQAAGKAGKAIELEIMRGEEKLTVQVKPAEIKDTDKVVERLQLDIPPSGFVFDNKEMLDQLKSKFAGENRMNGVFAISGTDELRKEIELMRKEIQELKEMIKELKNK